MLGYLSDGNYDGMVRGHMLRDCSVTTADIANARAIYGPNRDTVRGKKTRQSPLPAVSNYVDVPRLIRGRCRDIDISAASSLGRPSLRRGRLSHTWSII